MFIVMLETVHGADLRGGPLCGRQWHGVPSGTRMVGLGYPQIGDKPGLGTSVVNGRGRLPRWASA